MQDFIKKHYSGVITGIISTMLFLYFLQPILELLARVLLGLMSFVGVAYLDDVYAKVSHLELIDFSFFMISMLATLLSCFFLASIFVVWKKTAEKKKFEDEIEGQDIETVGIKRKIVLSSIFFLLFIFCSFYIATRFYQLNLISSFKQHMRVIAPYVSEEKEELLLSRWSLMKTEKDYKEINMEINEIAKKNGITLPKNRIYSLRSL